MRLPNVEDRSSFSLSLTLSTNAGVFTLPLVGAVSDVAVRLTPAEFGEVHVDGARNIPLDRLDLP